MAINFKNKFIGYELRKELKSPSFSFTCYKENIDWNRIAQVDLDRVVHDLDIGVLQDHVNTIVHCDLGDLRGIDPGLVKLFRLSQLCLEYSIFCQEQLTSGQEQLQHEYEQALKEIEYLTKELATKKDELKKEIKKRKKLNQQKENIFTSAFQCTMCPKAFMSTAFLESHLNRRHQELEPREVEQGRLKAEIERLQQQLCTLKEESSSAALQAKEIQLTREEALWAKVEKVQAEQRARHQAELTNLTETFQTQLKSSLANLQLHPGDTRTLDLQKQESIRVLKMQLDAQREEEMQTARELAEEVWQQRLTSMETRHQAERDRLHEELEICKAQEQSLLTALEAKKQEAVDASAASALQSVPKPATRHKRTEHQNNTPLLSKGKPSNNTTVIAPSAKRSPTEVVTPPPPAPRRRLQLKLPQLDTPVEAESHRELQNGVTKNPELAAPVKSLRNTWSVASPSDIPRSSPVRPLSSSSGSDHDDQSFEQTIEDMKGALKQHPDILNSLRQDVESHVNVRLAQLGINADTESLGQSESSRISNLLSHHRKLSKKKFNDYSHVRHDLEKIIQTKLVEQGIMEEKVVNDPSMRPSKLSSGHPGFLARLTHHYHRKNKRKAEKTDEVNIHTSTPARNTEYVDAPTSILKLSREHLWLGGTTISAPATPTKFDGEAWPLARTQSLPGAKSVTFATTATEHTSPSSSSWDQDLDSAPALSQMEALKDEKPTSGNVAKTKETPKSAFQKSGTRQQHSVTASIQPDRDHEKALDFLTSSLPSTSGASDFLKPGNKTSVPAKIPAQSLPDKDDNSWDLEDV